MVPSGYQQIVTHTDHEGRRVSVVPLPLSGDVAALDVDGRLRPQQETHVPPLPEPDSLLCRPEVLGVEQGEGSFVHCRPTGQVV